MNLLRNTMSFSVAKLTQIRKLKYHPSPSNIILTLSNLLFVTIYNPLVDCIIYESHGIMSLYQML
jgi:hypothetical protein